MNLYEIYPKQFRNINIPVQRDLCFVLMPFANQFDNLYYQIKASLSKFKISCLRDDEILGSQPFMNKVLTHIIKARYVIVVLTSYRPNVLYELGIAHCFKDVQNVLVLVEKSFNIEEEISKNFSDISHLTYVHYDINDLSPLNEHLENFINNSNSILDFQEYLYENGLLSNISDSGKEFIEYIENYFKSHFSIFVELLYDRNINICDQTFLLEKCCELLYNQIDEGGKYLDAILKIYATILIKSESLSCSNEHVKSLLTDGFIRGRVLTEYEIDRIKVDFAVCLASQDKFLNILIPWIINYFQRTHSSRIDLNRYKLEHYLISSNNTELNNSICNAVSAADFHVREHMSDIIGEKKLRQAFTALCNQLEKETNLYAGKSIIVALGHIGNGDDKSAGEVVLSWLYKHIQNIINSGQDFTNSILTKSYRALKNLYEPLIDNFNEELLNYITNMNY